MNRINEKVKIIEEHEQQNTNKLLFNDKESKKCSFRVSGAVLLT